MTFDNILIFRIGNLGDILAALPAFWSVRESLPAAKLTLLTNGKANSQVITAVDFLPENGLFDEIIEYPVNRRGWRKIIAELKTLRTLRRKKFDCVIYLMTRNRTVKQLKRDRRFFEAGGIKYFIGMDYLVANLLNYNIKRPLPEVETESDFCLKSLTNSYFSITAEPCKTDLEITAEEREAVEKWLDFNQPNWKEKHLIGVAPGSKWESKIWDGENYAEVLGRLQQIYPILPVILGGTEDRADGEKILKKIGTGANAAGIFSVRQSAAFLEKCAFYLGNDTGTMHLAASVGIRCAAIFAAIDFPNRWLPVGGGHFVFRRQIECEGCHSAVCPYQNQCLKMIHSEEVYEACISIISESKIVSR